MPSSMYTCKMMIMVKEKITKDMVLGEVVKKYPQTVDVFLKYGLPCAMCHVAYWETVEQGAKAHAIKVKKLLRDLNKAIKKK